MFNPHLVNRPMTMPEAVLGMWQEDLLGAREFGGMFHLTLHPQLTGDPLRLRMLRRLVETIKSHDDVWIATRKDVARHWLDQVAEPAQVRDRRRGA